MPFIRTPLGVSDHCWASMAGSHVSSRMGAPLPVACQHRCGCPIGLICTGPIVVPLLADAVVPPTRRTPRTVTAASQWTPRIGTAPPLTDRDGTITGSLRDSREVPALIGITGWRERPGGPGDRQTVARLTRRGG